MKLAFIPLIFFAVLSGCAKYDQKQEIKDANKPETLILQKKAAQGSIVSYKIHGSGSISGTAEIQIILNNSVYHTETINGNISFTWGGDWYSDTAEIRYIPKDVSGGHILIEYSFGDLK